MWASNVIIKNTSTDNLIAAGVDKVSDLDGKNK